MAVIESTVDRNGAEFQGNEAALLKTIGEMRAIQQKVVDKSYEAKPKFEKRNQVLPHERVQMLLDHGSPFVELCGLAGYQMHDDKDGSDAGGGIISGIGYVNGTRCLVSASNSAIKGGTISPAGLYKSLRLQQIALQNKLPVITLTESGGANLNYAGEIFVEGARSFANQARLSAAGIPLISVVHGNATAGGAYQPGLSDYVIVVRKQTQMFLAGPPLLLAATGEIASEEELGGAEMHAQVAGTAEYLAENDADGIRIARDIVGMLNWKENTPAGEREHAEPLYPIDDLLGLVPTDQKKPFDMKEVIARLVDASDFLEFKTEYDNQTVCGWARIGGYMIGIITNNGPITPQGAAKASQFIQLCDQTQCPCAEDFAGGGRVLRCRQLRHVRPWSRSALYFCLAQLPHRRHGWGTGRQGTAYRQRAEAEKSRHRDQPTDAGFYRTEHRRQTRRAVHRPVQHCAPVR